MGMVRSSWRKQLTLDQQAAILNAHEAGASPYVLADLHGVHYFAVMALIQEDMPMIRFTNSASTNNKASKRWRCRKCGATLQTEYCIGCYVDTRELVTVG